MGLWAARRTTAKTHPKHYFCVRNPLLREVLCVVRLAWASYLGVLHMIGYDCNRTRSHWHCSSNIRMGLWRRQSLELHLHDGPRRHFLESFGGISGDTCLKDFDS